MEDHRYEAGFSRRNSAIAGLSRACPARSLGSARYSAIAMEVYDLLRVILLASCILIKTVMVTLASFTPLIHRSTKDGLAERL